MRSHGAVCYVHLLRFPLQRRVQETPALAGQPLVLWEEARGVRRVAFAAAVAQKAGVRAGMTLTAAQALLPTLVPLPYVPLQERQALASLGEALLGLGPHFQLSPPDGLWLDASAAHLFGGALELGARVLELCASQGYRAQVVLAQERFTSRAIARHALSSANTPVLQIEPSGSAAALRSLPLSALEEAHGAVLAPLAGLGLKTLGDVACLPAGAVLTRLGAEGLQAHRLCRGQDDTPLCPEPLTEVLEETMGLDWPAESQEPVLFVLKTLLDRLCARLRGRSLCTARLEIMLRLDSKEERSMFVSLARPSAQPRLLLELARQKLSELSVTSAVAQVCVRAKEVSEDPGQQLSLGDTPEGDAPLELVLSRLSSTLGEGALGAPEVQARHRPEQAMGCGSFRPQAQARGLVGELTPASNAVLVPCPEERPARLFARPATLEAEVDVGGELRSARVGGRRRKVVALSGPERLVGDWWERAFSRDYYRVHFEGLGPVWVYRDTHDGRFYLQGMFD